MNYSDRHVQYLLNGIDRVSRHFARTLGEDTFGQLRHALREGEHANYRILTKKHGLCLCELCHVITVHHGTKRCDGCWELETRIDRTGDLRMWSSTPKGIITLHRIKKNVEDQIQASPLKEAFLRGDFS